MGSGVVWRVDAEGARSLTDTQPSTFQDDAVGPALDRLAGSADALLASDVLAVVPAGVGVRAKTMCNGDTCGSMVAIAPNVNFQIDISTSDLKYTDPDAEYQGIGTHRGVQISQGQGPTEISGLLARFATVTEAG